MRKALIVPAIALAATTAVAAPTVAFAADATTPASAGASASPGTGAGDDAQPQHGRVELALSASSGKAGDQVQVTVTTDAKVRGVSVSSKAFGAFKLVQAKGKEGVWTGTATVARADAGRYGVAVWATGAGKPLTTTGSFTVTADKPTPAPQASFVLSKDNGAPGDRIGLTVKNAKGPVTVVSDALGGTVHLVQDRSAAGVWHGEATVAKGAKLGYYGIKAYDGSTLVGTVKFTVTEARGGHHDGKDPDHTKPAPLTPSRHKTPTGSVNTGMAPVGESGGGTGDRAALGAGAALASVGLLGGGRVLLGRRKGQRNG
ncbi:hypothetical protein ABH931_000444 [Streptacidiphilus sp. MAP12-33]|uniref:hypothetical protein n=1 Tax=Streptacidiphilus sp. MAP12-33 TaxID=3156266 RepID=UPI003515040F